MTQKQLPFRLFTAAVFIVLIVPQLIRDGMFMDGVQYAVISKNLAHGIGSFWQPFLSHTWNKNGSSAFLEHPPLVYWIQSLFFRILGDGRYTERIYSLTTAVVTAWIIAKIWRLLFRNNELHRNMEWLPVLFWISTPICFWSFQNNMQENTMGAFTLAAVYFSLKAFIINEKRVLYISISGLLVFLATLCKGIPGLFPVAAAGIWWISKKGIGTKQMLLFTVLLLGIPALLYLIVLQNPEAYRSMHFWFFERVMARMQNEPTSDNRFDLLWRIFTELLPSIIITAVAIFMSLRKNISFKETPTSTLWFFFLLGLAGSAPMMLSLVQKGFYLAPVFPLFAICLSMLALPAVSTLANNLSTEGLKFRILKYGLMTFLGLSLIFSAFQSEKYSRDQNILTTVHNLGKILPEGSTVEIDSALYEDWSMQFYLLRYNSISVTTKAAGLPYFLSLKSVPETRKGYERIPFSSEEVFLFQKTNR